MTARLDPLALVGAMVLEDGQRWGEVAHDFQLADLQAVVRAEQRRHFLLRGRGLSKSTDVAALALALMIAEAPPRARGLVFATDADQAALLVDALSGLVARTPGLAAAVEVGARSVTVRASKAVLTVESSDAGSAFGHRPWLTIVDELASWPRTANHRRLWSAIVSAVPKVPGGRLLVLTAAGAPTSLAAEVWSEAEKSPHWHTSRTPGPSPWWTPDDIEATRASLTASEWARLIECRWAEGDDSLATVEDVEAAFRAGEAVLEPRAGTRYVAALDVGTRRDLTALAVGHAERTEVGRIVVIDRVTHWRPEPGAGGAGGARVDLAEVEAAVLRICRAYRAPLRFDRMQAEQMTTNLTRAGVRCEEYVFSSAGTNKLARGLWVALRDRALSVPDDAELRDEFGSVRLVETGPSTVKLSNPAGHHDDVVTAIGMVVATLTARQDVGPGGVTNPSQLLRGGIGRTLHDATPTSAGATRAALVAAAAKGPRIPGGAVILPGTGNDPRRVGLRGVGRWSVPSWRR
ncbi:terminase large subunit domain-containing protein [Micropruina sp.]|uniref:terminase large subunit domain-containing protein n=1 Tax=Micropruina sp. TaxID=2737536 RepID=UPI0039E40D0D